MASGKLQEKQRDENWQVPFKTQLSLAWGFGGALNLTRLPAPWGASLLRISWRRGCKHLFFFFGFLVVRSISTLPDCNHSQDQFSGTSN